MDVKPQRPEVSFFKEFLYGQPMLAEVIRCIPQHLIHQKFRAALAHGFIRSAYGTA